MKLIPRYIIRQMSVMAVYALLAFLALYSFFEVINEMGDVGKGSYTGAKMAQYVLMQMPARAGRVDRRPDCLEPACLRQRTDRD